MLRQFGDFFHIMQVRFHWCSLSLHNGFEHVNIAAQEMIDRRFANQHFVQQQTQSVNIGLGVGSDRAAILLDADR